MRVCARAHACVHSGACVIVCVPACACGWVRGGGGPWDVCGGECDCVRACLFVWVRA